MQYSKAFVYQEIIINNITLFLWYKLADHDSNDYIVPDKLLTPDEHYKALAYD